jgi:UDP-GlcNAc3NAcA epimerase
MKVLTVVGARPQFVKAAVVSRAFGATAGVRELIVHTGQHHDANMSDVFFDEMEIPRPAFHLGIHGVGHGAMTGRMIEALEVLFLQEKPDRVLVYGDTNSTLAGALAAVKLHIPIAHVEAGLRSFNMRMPEEVNRILTDRVSKWLFCPTQTAVDNLNKEGYPFSNMQVHLSGDVMQDAALFYAERSPSRSNVISKLGLKSFVLCTIHRAENTDDLDRLRAIAAALSEIHRQTPVVCPLHPRTRKLAAENKLELPFTVIDPVGYFDMIELLKHCQAVVTDSGGLQKEAYFFSKPCITLRDETEWTELVDSGCNVLAGANRERILQCWSTLPQRQPDFNSRLYGGGCAAEKIVDTLLRT